LVNKRPLLTLLLQAASQTLLQFGRQNLGGQLGGIQVLHPWDQTLGAHFHVHCLVPGGALGENGTRWVPTQPRFLFPVHALSMVFRGKSLDALHSRTAMGPLVVPEETETLATPEGFRRFIDQLYTKTWIVYAKQSMGGPGPVLDYLSRYTHRVALANHRIVDVQAGQVRFPYRNRRQGNRVQTMTLEAHEFIRRFLLHVVPQRLQRMRHIGFLANRCKARALRQCRQLLNQLPDPPVRSRVLPSGCGSGQARISPAARNAARGRCGGSPCHRCRLALPPGRHCGTRHESGLSFPGLHG
jgi:hypothetical protein